MFKILILFFVGIAVCYFLAKAILKFIPKKVRPVISLLLYGVAILLAYTIYGKVMEPIHFKQEKEAKYTQVINRLKVIRDAQADHKTVTGTFAKTLDDLVQFIDTANFAVTESKNEVRSVNKGGGITVEEEFLVIDTIGTEPVVNKYASRNYKDLKKVPGTDAEFELKLGEVQKSHGDMRPVYEVKVAKTIVLDGMNPDLVRLEKATENNDQVKGAFIRVGSLEEVSDSGNWPPSYDIHDKKE
ncbi:hypothetical protein KH5_16770 [Urechidicola sp. KH5]